MKNIKKLLVLLLAAVMVFSLVACGGDGNDVNQGNENNDSGIRGDEGTSIDRNVGLTEEQLENYIVEFTVTEPASEEDGDKVIETTKKFYASEVAFEGGYRHSLNADNENAIYGARDNSCFTYTEQDDYRGWFAAHKQYIGDGVNEDKLTLIGEEKIADFDTKHYEFKMGIFDIHFWVCEEYDLTVKYENYEKDFNTMEFVLKNGLEVTKLEFGTVEFADFFALPTPAPAADDNGIIN